MLHRLAVAALVAVPLVAMPVSIDPWVGSVSRVTGSAGPSTASVIKTSDTRRVSIDNLQHARGGVTHAHDQPEPVTLWEVLAVCVTVAFVASRRMG